MRHVKWAMMLESKIDKVEEMLRNLGCKNISHYVDKIVKTDTNEIVMEAYVVEFDIYNVVYWILKEKFNLQEIQGYLM